MKKHCYHDCQILDSFSLEEFDALIWIDGLNNIIFNTYLYSFTGLLSLNIIYRPS